MLALATVAVAAPTATIALAADDSAPTTTLPRVELAASSVSIHDQLDAAADQLAARQLRAKRRVLRVARKVAALRGTDITQRYVRKLDRFTVSQLNRRHLRLKRTLRELRRTGGAPDVAIPGVLASIAACESGGNPRAIGGGGAYRGKYQFSYSTWASVGGSGDPAAAPEAEQDRRAAMLYARSGPGQWPVCGR
ncbi:MAG TPA: transglycosylase family protein [Solirubrobacteraceae bacterium]